MSQNTQNSRTSEDKDGEDLTTILDQTQRADLTLLVATITESMRALLVENFDAAAGLNKSFVVGDMTEDEKMMSSDPQSMDVEEMDKQRKLKEEYEKDLASLKMKNLKKNSLKAFDDWREQILLRVGEVVNSRETAKRQLEGATPQASKPGGSATVGKITGIPQRGTTLKFKDLYPPSKNPLTKMSMDQRALILHSMLLLILSLKQYSALSRVLLLLLTSSLKLPLKTFEQDEYVTAKGLLDNAKEMTAQEETKKKVEENKDSRKWKVGLATAAGAAIIGVTGGLAAPLVAAGVGSVMGGLGLGATSAAAYLGSVAGSTYLIGGLFGAYGGRMTGNMMDKYAKEVEDFEFIPVHSRNKTSENEKEGAKQASDHDHKLRVTICISGWLTDKEEVLKPWRVLGTGAEVFALKYELEAMLNLGNGLKGLVESAAWGYAKKQIIAQTIFADLAAAIWPIGLLKAARIVDNPFNIAKTRSEKAGEVLADALINRAQGERPVTLIGYSLGARVIYSCLMSLAKRKAFGLIENAVLVGAPTPSDTSDWRILRTVVCGRLINVYSENDYVLGFMYRTSSLQYGVAGLQAVQGLPGIENVDVSDEVSGHLRYRYLMGSILQRIGFEDIDMQAVEEEKQALQKMEEEEKKRSLQSQRRRLMRRESTGGKEDEAEEADREAGEIEKEVQAKTQKSLLTKAIEYFYVPGPANTENAEKMAQNVEKSAGDPSKVGSTAANSAQSSAQPSLTQRAYAALPSMPHLGFSDTQPDTKDTSAGGSQGAAANAGDSAQSYTSRAASYLPSVPKNLPSMPKSLPSMPSLGNRGKGEAQAKSKVTDAADKTTAVSQQTVQKAASTADNVIRPTVRNTLNPQDNPATKSIRNAANQDKALPNTVQKAGEQLSSSAGGSLHKTVQKATSTGQKITSTMTDASKTAASSNGPSSMPAQDSNQSYTSYAASYLPSMPKAIPGWSSGRKAPPKLERKGSSGIKSPPPKLERRAASGLASAVPKLGVDNASSEKKS